MDIDKIMEDTQTLVENRHFKDADIQLDGYHFKNCRFYNCVFYWQTNDYRFTKCYIDCTIVDKGTKPNDK
jgi:hypothetical protein